MPDPLGGFAYTWPFYACGLVAYLIGSIPFGLLMTRLAGVCDLRRVGSGNIGATNVLRTGKKGLAAATLALDGGKGALAVVAAKTFGPDMAVIAAASAVIGHVFPVWLKFRGGKGVATALGCILAIAWPVGLMSCAMWLGVAFITRYSSVAGMLAVTVAPVFAWYFADPQRAELMIFLAVVVVLRHYDNIRRLMKGEESRIGASEGAASKGEKESPR